MSDCPGMFLLLKSEKTASKFHCSGCTENAQLRATLAQRTAALRMLLDWVEDEEECATLDSMIAQARQALTETPAT